MERGEIMKENQKMIFLTASGILVAILLVWAQLWTIMAQEYKHQPGMTMITAGYGLSCVYYAIFTAFLSFILIIIQRSLSKISLVLFSYSIILTFLLVLSSLIGVVWKTSSGSDVLTPFTPYWLSWFINAPVWVVIISPIGLFIVLFVLALCCPCLKKMFARLIKED